MSEEFNDIVVKTDRLLWDAFQASTTGTFPSRSPRIVFPRYRDGSIRVSEQEARCLFISQLNTSAFLYSVETPTTGEYAFQEGGQSKRSAATDLTVYAEHLKPLFGVEFKAHGFSLDRQSSVEITKDVEKLLREPVDGFWFHTLEAADNSTIKNVWSVILRDLRLVGNVEKGVIAMKRFVFHVCVLRQRFALQADVLIRPEEIGPDWLSDFPMPDYKLSRGKLRSSNVSPPWAIHSG